MISNKAIETENISLNNYSNTMEIFSPHKTFAILKTNTQYNEENERIKSFIAALTPFYVLITLKIISIQSINPP